MSRAILKAIVSVVGAVLACATGLLWAQLPDSFYRGPAKELSASEAGPALLQLKQAVAAGLPLPFEVETTRLYPLQLPSAGQPPLAAEEIILHSGSTLILVTPPSNTVQSDRSIYIVAKRIRVLPGSRPPTITWQRPDAVSTYPPPVGRAPPGRPGPGSGEPGSPGANGAPGNAGFQGQSAPTIYLALQEIVGGTVFFDLRGQDGGPGGRGQDGGEGGPGQAGAPASQSLFDCRRGGGNGGAGGKGGDGGIGGRGGRGGDGGTLVLMSSPPNIAAIQSAVRLQGSGGNSGPPGKGGIGGPEGVGGAGGPGAQPYCGGGNPGPRGSEGIIGGDSVVGERGQGGALVVIPLSEANYEAIGLR